MADLMRRQSRPFFLTELQDEINKLFNLSTSTGNGPSEMMGDFLPAIDIKDQKDHFLICADLPGVDPQKIEINVNNNTLTLRGEKETEQKENKEGYVRVERAKGTFIRQFTLPDSIDADNISAKSKNGVLEIRIPKSKKDGARKINVNVEG